MHYHRFALAATPRATRYTYPPSSRAHRLEALPNWRKPAYRTRQPTAAPKSAPQPAVLLYRLETGRYLASLNGAKLEFGLFSVPRPLPAPFTVHSEQHLSQPQTHHPGKSKCAGKLQSPFNELLTILWELEVPVQARAAGVTALFVGDYKADHPNHKLMGCILAAAYGKPGPNDTQPGWLLLLVGGCSRAPRHRAANAAAAVGLLRQALPELSGWLAPLLANETGPSEGIE